MATWQMIALGIAAVIVVFGVAILLAKGVFQVTGIEIGWPPKLTLAPKSSQPSIKPPGERSVSAKTESSIADVDMTDATGGKKTVNAEDHSKIKNIKM